MKTKLTHNIIFEEKEMGLKPTDDLVNGLIKLFSDTVHSVNVVDYTYEQLSTWAPEDIDPKKWMDRVKNNYMVTAKDGNIVVGFGELTFEGCIDMLYVDNHYLLQKIGQQLLDFVIIKPGN
jgi:putative acetyltransferase